MTMRLTTRYALVGVLLGLGAPLGFLVLHALLAKAVSLHWVAWELQDRLLDYVYLTSSTCVVFAIMGWILARREEKLIASALTDPLTGLANRRHMVQRIGEELARATRYRVPLSLLIIDVDWLKRINDHDGHAAGDQALRKIGEAIRGCCRVIDLAARYGGDEFMVLAPNTTATAGVDLGERIRSTVKKLTDGKLTISVGVADLDDAPAAEVDALCIAADQALYWAKRQGRDRVARVLSVESVVSLESTQRTALDSTQSARN